MKYLSELKPAETLLLLEGKNADFKNLMKFTFMDLVLKQVLVVKESTRTYKSGRRYKEQKTKYVIKGENFDRYNPSPFEVIYLSTFQKSPEIKAILTKLIKVAYDAIDTEKKYRKSILNSSPIKDLFNASFLQQLFGTFALNKNGLNQKAQVQSELKDIDDRIGEMLTENPKEALQILIEIGGNLFLLKNVNFDLLRKVDQSIMQSMKIESHFDSTYNDSGWWIGLDSCHDSFDSFDSGYDSAGCSSHDSGCSSCSGCSGCGGCGGCN